MKQLKSLTELREIAKRHGYFVRRNLVDPIDGRLKKYVTAPITAGGWGFFETKRQLQNYMEQLEQVASYLVD